jgi:hypothetical protein
VSGRTADARARPVRRGPRQGQAHHHPDCRAPAGGPCPAAVPGTSAEPAVGRRPDLRRDLVRLGLRRVRHGRLLPPHRRLALLHLATHRPGRRRPRARPVATSPRRPRSQRLDPPQRPRGPGWAQPVVATPRRTGLFWDVQTVG